MSKHVNENIIIEGARIMFRNFAGKEDRFNMAGDRNFCVILDDDELVDNLVNDGWSVRGLEQDEDKDFRPYLPVRVKYEPFPPKIVLVTSNGLSVLPESEVDILDTAEIENIDIIIRPYNWEVNGKQGIKAYVKSMYITLMEDDLDKKYKALLADTSLFDA